MNDIFEFFKISLSRTPELAILGVIVWLFLRAQKERNADDKLTHTELITLLKLMHDDYKLMHAENQEARQHSRTVIENDVRALAQIEKVIERCTLGKRDR